VSNSGLFCPTGLGALTQCKVAWSFPSCFYDLSSDWNHLLSTGPLDYRVFCLTDGKGPRSTLDTVKSFQMVYPQCWIISWYCAAVCTIAVLLFCKWLMEGLWCRTLHQHQWRGGGWGGQPASLLSSAPFCKLSFISYTQKGCQVMHQFPLPVSQPGTFQAVS
jgi:hypothetical protein